MINLILLEKILKLEYFALWRLWEDLNIDWTDLDNIHDRLSAKHYKHDIEFRFWDFNNGNFEGVYSFICDCVDAIFIQSHIRSSFMLSLIWTAKFYSVLDKECTATQNHNIYSALYHCFAPQKQYLRLIIPKTLDWLYG